MSDDYATPPNKAPSLLKSILRRIARRAAQYRKKIWKTLSPGQRNKASPPLKRILRKIARRAAQRRGENWNAVPKEQRKILALQAGVNLKKSGAGGKQTLDIMHIGKTGGTALRAIIHAKRTKIKSAGFQPVFHGHKLSLVDVTAIAEIRAQQQIVFFVREPVSRFSSGFYSRMRQGLPDHYNPWSADERIAFEMFKTPGQLAEALDSADIATRTAGQLAMHVIVHVSMPLARTLSSPDVLNKYKDRMFLIGTQETFEADVKTLLKKLDVDDKIPTITKEERHAGSSQEDRFISEQGISNLRKWYAGDYEIYEWVLKNRDAINAAT